MCVDFCDELLPENKTFTECACEEGWTGDFCEIEVTNNFLFLFDFVLITMI